jgi:hypothetical protein
MLAGMRILPLIAAGLLLSSGASAQEEHRLSRPDRTRLAETIRVAGSLGSRLWPGLERTPLAILLVTDSAEYLLGHPAPTTDFSRIGYDSLLKMDVRRRPRVFAPTLLATFPAVAGLPTIVVGTAPHTGKSSSEWVLTLLHEHFHQWQSSLPDYYGRVAALDLAGGDSTGMWMLDYPFPYDSAPVQRATGELAKALSAALGAAPASRQRALSRVVTGGRVLARHLAASDRRYLEFQLWQEGVARFIEYQAARLATDLSPPAAAFTKLSDYEPYSGLASRHRSALQQELERFDLGKNRRVSFYSLGAAYALLMERTNPQWKQMYEATPFVMTELLEAEE